jgi:hypothetical protein
MLQLQQVYARQPSFPVQLARLANFRFCTHLPLFGSKRGKPAYRMIPFYDTINYYRYRTYCTEQKTLTRSVLLAHGADSGPSSS